MKNLIISDEIIFGITSIIYAIIYFLLLRENIKLKKKLNMHNKKFWDYLQITSKAVMQECIKDEDYETAHAIQTIFSIDKKEPEK